MIIPVTLYNVPLLLACTALDLLFFLTTVLVVMKRWRKATRQRVYERLETILEWPLDGAERILCRLRKGSVPSWMPLVCVLLVYLVCRHILTILIAGP